MRGDHFIPNTSSKIEFDHSRNDYYGEHGRHCHVVSGHVRIASVDLENLKLFDGALDGKEGRLAMEWIRNNAPTLRSDANYWVENGSIWQ